MASISSNPIIHCHARSISLPSRSSQLSEFDGKVFEASTSSSSIGHRINALKDLYSAVDNLLLLPTTQRALAQEHENTSVNELVDGILRLLDLCSTAKDALLMTRNSAQQLQSVLRRKRGDNFGLMCAIQEYQSQRKKVKKAVHKALRDSQKSGNKRSSSLEVATTLKEVESVTSAVFESIFSIIHGSKSQPNSTRWSLVSKLMGSKHISCDETLERTEVEKVDAEMSNLISQKAKQFSSLQVENAQKQLVELELILQDLEEGLDHLHRHLIKTRVSLLNLLNY